MGKHSAESFRKRKERRLRSGSANILQEMLLELMNERKLQLVDVQRGTGIPWATLMDFIKKTSKTQQLDSNILALSRYFNVSINYLAFGVGEDPVYKNEESA